MDSDSSNSNNKGKEAPKKKPKPANTLKTESVNKPYEHQSKNDDQIAWEKLEVIYNSWTDISIEEGQEYRKPNSRGEIRQSRKILRKLNSLNLTDKDVLNRIKELKGVTDSTAAAIPNYLFRIAVVWVFSLAIIIGFFYYPSQNKFNVPDFDYNTEWFVTEKGGYLTQRSFVTDKQMPDVKQKVYLKKGTQLKPLGRMGTYWIQVETPDGQRGFVHFNILQGARYVEADKDAKVYDKIDGKEFDTISPGTKATIQKWKVIRKRNLDYIYINIKLEDGTVKWANDYDFSNLIYTNMPSVNQTYDYRTTIDLIETKLIGDSLSSIEKRYGTATSHIVANGKNQAFFNHLVIIDSSKHYRGIMVNLDENNIATDIEYTKDGVSKFYDYFPLMKTMWSMETFKVASSSLYLTTGKNFSFQWWEDFKDKNWFTTVIGWIVSFIKIILGIFLLFSIPRLVIAPITQFFALTRFLNNGLVILINLILYFIAAYLFFIFMVVTGEQWFVMAIATVLVFVFWAKRHYSNVLYNRCPACFAMYVAIDEGSSFTGRTTNETWGKWEKDKGYTYSGNTKTHHVELRDQKTTEHVDHYLDHRMCARCGCDWDVDRDESEEITKQY